MQHDVDALRARLRALGYLDAPVDRFVLGGAVSHRRAVILAATASARIAVLTGLVLGPAALLGLIMRAPDLVTGPADAAVLAAYLAVPFGLAAGALTFLGALIAGWVAHHRTASAAGLVVAGASLVYLTLWWRAAVPASGWWSEWPALGVAAAIAVLIAHVVTVSILAYLVRLGRTRVPDGTPWSSVRVVVPTGVAALAVALVLLRALTPASAPAATAPPLTVVPTGHRVLVVAVDGVDVPMLDALRVDGRVPTWDRLLDGVRLPLRAGVDRDPAQVWTTIATGQPASRHGIRALEGRQLAGVEGRVQAGSRLTTAMDLLRLTRPTIVSGGDRRVPTFWEVASAAGLRTATVHWWATWPADDSMGTVLTDRAILRLEQGGPLAAEMVPASIYQPLLDTADTRAVQVGRLAAGVGDDLHDDVRHVMERSAHLDATIIALALDPALGGEAAQDVLTVYLPGLDIAQHALFPLHTGAPLAPAAAAERVRALERYYAFLDRAMAALLPTDRSERTVTVLVTQPGRVAVTPDAEAGLVAVTGPAVAAGRAAATHALESIAPTILRALGVPQADDLASPAIEAIWSEGFTRTFPLRTVATYGERRTTAGPSTGRALDREMVERMRSLGYVR